MLINNEELNSVFTVLRGNEGCGKSFGIFNNLSNPPPDIIDSYGDKAIFYICPSIKQTVEKYNSYSSIHGQSKNKKSKNPELLKSKSEILRKIIKSSFPDLYDNIKSGINAEHTEFIYDGFLVSKDSKTDSQSIRFEHKNTREKELVRFQWKHNSQNTTNKNPLSGNFVVSSRMIYKHLNEIIKNIHRYPKLNGIGLVVVESMQKTDPVAYNHCMDLKVFNNVEKFLTNDLKTSWWITKRFLEKIDDDGYCMNPDYRSISYKIDESYFESKKPIIIEDIQLDKSEVFPGNGNYTNHDKYKIKILFLSKKLLNEIKKELAEATKQYNDIFKHTITEHNNKIFFIDQSNFLYHFKQMNEKNLKYWSDSATLIFDEFPLLNSPFLTIEELNAASAVYSSKYDSLETIMDQIKLAEKHMKEADTDEVRHNVSRRINNLKSKLKRKYNKNIEDAVKFLDDPELSMNKDLFKDNEFKIINPLNFQDKNFKAGNLLFVPDSQKKNFFNIFYENDIQTIILTTEIIPVEYMKNNFDGVNIEDRTNKIENESESALAYIFTEKNEYNDLLPISKNKDSIREFIKSLKKDDPESILVISNNQFEGDITSTSIKGSNIFIKRDKSDNPIKEVHYFISPENPKSLAKTFMKVYGNKLGPDEDSIFDELNRNEDLKEKYYEISVNKMTDSINQTLGRFFGERGKILKKKPAVYIYAYNDKKGIALEAMERSRYNIKRCDYNDNEIKKDKENKVDDVTKIDKKFDTGRESLKTISEWVYNAIKESTNLNEKENVFLSKKINKKIYKEKWKLGFNNIIINSLEKEMQSMRKIFSHVKKNNDQLFNRIESEYNHELDKLLKSFSLHNKKGMSRMLAIFQKSLNGTEHHINVETMLDCYYIIHFIFQIETAKICLIKNYDHSTMDDYCFSILKPTIIENKKLEIFSKTVLSLFNTLQSRNIYYQKSCTAVGSSIYNRFKELFYKPISDTLLNCINKNKYDKKTISKFIDKNCNLSLNDKLTNYLIYRGGKNFESNYNVYLQNYTLHHDKQDLWKSILKIGSFIYDKIVKVTDFANKSILQTIDKPNKLMFVWKERIHIKEFAFLN